MEDKDDHVILEFRRSPACGGESRKNEWSVGVVEIVQTVKIVKAQVAEARIEKHFLCFFLLNSDS